MNYYFLPGVGIYGGIKVGFQFVDLLRSLGVQIVVATPGGTAPRWFSSAAPIVSREDLLPNLQPSDTAFFSLPHDYAVLQPTGARLVFHCQGTDPLIDPTLRDPKVMILTCWQQAADYAREKLRDPIEVGISISDCFFYDGALKEASSMAHMPRRGAEVTETIRQNLPGLRLGGIDGADEESVAAMLKRSNYFLATSEGEWFGLPALEAMAAACVVISLPVLGGVDYLSHRKTAMLAERDGLLQAVREVCDHASARLRERLRVGGQAVAAKYRRSLQRTKLQEALRGPLGEALA